MFEENIRGHLRFLTKHQGLRAAERARLIIAAGCLIRAPRDRQFAGIARQLLSSRVPELLRPR
jgi:hypothetical protein